jgi:hypothetical protein
MTTSRVDALEVTSFEEFSGIVAPAVAPLGKGRIYFDSTTNTFKSSQNGAPYFEFEHLESADLILLPEGREGAESTRVAQVNFDGASQIVRRPASLSRLVFHLTAVTLPATIRVLLFQAPTGGSGIANRIASMTFPLVAAGAQTLQVVFTEGTVTFEEGLVSTLFGRSAGAGSVTMRTYVTQNYDLLSSVVSANTHPTSFTTAILSSSLPATFDPLPVAGGGQAIPTLLNVAPVLRMVA